MSTRLAIALTLLLAPATTAGAQPAAAPTPEGVEFFEKKVRPVLVAHCYSCHSADAKRVKGELRLDTREAVLKGGTSGPAVVPGDPAKSLLIRAVRHADPDLKMPPDKRLAAAEVADLEAWVKMGAPDPRVGGAGTAAKKLDLERAKQFWSFKPVVRPAVPQARIPADVRNPIDAFVLAALDARSLTPAPPADPRALIRRATFDLTGLPPTPEEVDAFLRDSARRTPHAAFEAVVERLLASPAYGERWGRHWLDVVRYADTAGDNSDYPVPQAYRYRNWVIDAVNRDLPYDEFVRAQLAGDLLPAASEADRRAKLVATGYLANTRRFGSYEDARYPWYLTYEDQIDNLGRTFLGLTISCARCHDHKFDPISQHDYYALYGFFASTRYPRPGIELDKVQRDFVPLATPDEVAAAGKVRTEKLAALTARVKELEADKADAAKVKAAKKERDDFEKAPPPYETAYAVAEGKAEGKKAVGNARVQVKGDPERLGPEVPRRFPAVLGGQSLPPGTAGSGRRHLADWIADPKNPLTARVMVNRIWQNHFGKGLVRTPSNFGALGQPPTHPELLDWLAAEFVEKGWSVKAVHRLVMGSRTYQQSGRDDAANAGHDAANDYLWRHDRRRLDAESIRDTLLAVGGNLDRAPGGPHPFPPQTGWNFTQHNPFKAVYDTEKRGVYVMTQRFQRHPFLALFDGADTNASTDRRLVSTTPLQALYLMNDPFVHAQAKRFAARVRGAAEGDAARVGRAYLLLFGRPPDAGEVAAATDYLAAVARKVGGPRAEDAAWESLARALFLSNEFVYLD
ncbi:MAG TPA: PSD1 and planctomycete cytochrome C domain-containing protein [Urbifossiella sp.]|nr:PSD1 and planctomycete cytochrome C domain-containing protein [Urbifossiella sp.]